jgi:hypothetical protein
MGIVANIIGGIADYVARVTPAGQLVVAPYDYDLVKFNSLAVVNTAYNYYVPLSGMEFVITSMLAFATKDVGDTTSTSIVIYEAGSPDVTTVDKVLFQFGMGKLTTLPITPLNIKVNQGKFINAKTDDNTIELTITGYYIPVAD